MEGTYVTGPPVPCEGCGKWTEFIDWYARQSYLRKHRTSQLTLHGTSPGSQLPFSATYTPRTSCSTRSRTASSRTRTCTMCIALNAASSRRPGLVTMQKAVRRPFKLQGYVTHVSFQPIQSLTPSCLHDQPLTTNSGDTEVSFYSNPCWYTCVSLHLLLADFRVGVLWAQLDSL